MARRVRGKFGFEIDPGSLDDLRRQLESELPKESQRAATTVVKKGTQELAIRLAREAPEDTGRLWRAVFSILYKKVRKLPVAGAARVKSGKKWGADDAFYYRFFAKGTKHMDPNDFVGRANQAMRPRFNELSREYVKLLVKAWERRKRRNSR
jgi:HK97 gp10 family phage protein